MLLGTLIVGALAVSAMLLVLTFLQDGECTRTSDLLAGRRKVICAISDLEWFGYGWYKTRRRLGRYNERLQADEKDSGENHDSMKIIAGYDNSESRIRH